MCRGIPFILSELFCRFKPAKEPAFLVVTDYDSGDLDWTKTFIPAAQKDWLRQELKKDDLPESTKNFISAMRKRSFRYLNNAARS